jgi:hypothetical protein
MSNVVSFRQAAPGPGPGWQARLVHSFACQRRARTDVFWLKENAELLGVMARLQSGAAGACVAPYEAFYQEAEKRLRFFPQYYRFFLSLCLDLEDLGLPGDRAERLAHMVQREGMHLSELSDLQRAEAEYLLGRRGIGGADPALRGRLMRFMSGDQGQDQGQNADQAFAVPNRKVAYELTHVIFYLSDYGRRPLDLSARACRNLEHVGTLAFLDGDRDLLAEVCLALRFVGRTPSPIWEAWLHKGQAAYRFSQAPGAGADDYHPYLVGRWWGRVAGHAAGPQPIPKGAFRIDFQGEQVQPLRLMSECLYQMGDQRVADWEVMRPHVFAALDGGGAAHLALAEAAIPDFAQFFMGFARAGSPAHPMPSDRKRRAASTGAGGVGVVDDETRADQLF